MLLLFLIMLLSATLLAQDAQEPDPSDTPHPLVTPRPVTPQPVAPDPAAPEPYIPLTLWQNYAWSANHMFNPGRLFFLTAKAAIDHSRNNPSGWGQGFEGYADRVSSRLGWDAVNGNIAFGVRVLDHEDPRYFRSPGGSVWKRVGYAAVRAFIVRDDHGGTMPAYSTFVADFATPFVAQTWRPERVNVGLELSGGAIGIGSAIAGNMYQEFWPDIRTKLLRFKRH